MYAREIRNRRVSLVSLRPTDNPMWHKKDTFTLRGRNWALLRVTPCSTREVTEEQERASLCPAGASLPVG